MCLSYFWETLIFKKMTEKLLYKFLKNRCTDKELDEVIQWINADALNKDSRNLALTDWKSYQNDDNVTSEVKFNSLLDKIHHKINIDRNNYLISENKTSVLSTYTTWLIRAAAILLFPVLAFLFYTLSEKSFDSINIADLAVDSLEIIAPIGSRTVVQLSDGSEVYLNYGSKIKYPQNFIGDTREVILSGEGYFNVEHNPEKPFIVKTQNLNIKALGTTFNVLAYPNEDFVATTLVEGKVVLEQTEINGENKTIGSMIPGQHVNYNIKTGEVLSSKGNIEKYIAWKDGKLVFENESINQMSERLSRIFNVDIEISNNIEEFTYTVTFVDEPLFQILDLMTLATPVSYKALPRKKLSDGTFSKQKIIIEKRK